ncbi:Rid family detoxifying hydrolase [Patescibacteria group bacterium]|nr:Rid family detoxifying hydrolase [Patescibacteria group bacterium]
MKKQVDTNKAPKADHILSQAIVSNGLIFVAGQIHNTVEGNLVDGSVQDKVRQIMANIAEVLAAENANLDDIVKVVVYVTDMSQMTKFNEVYTTYFKKPYPAREAVCVKELPLGATIEISVIATKE